YWWHDHGFEEEEHDEIGIEIEKYDLPEVHVETFEVPADRRQFLRPTHPVKCKYEKRNTGNGPKNEENTDSYETLQCNPYDSVTVGIKRLLDDLEVTAAKVENHRCSLFLLSALDEKNEEDEILNHLKQIRQCYDQDLVREEEIPTSPGGGLGVENVKSGVEAFILGENQI
ncbi:hypothetical protein Tco_0999236, partial [Tanacetum coccineum]